MHPTVRVMTHQLLKFNLQLNLGWPDVRPY